MLAHLMTFATIGGIAFVIDSGLTLILIDAGTSPYLARVPAMAASVIFSWLAHRRFTFKVTQAKNASEALRYVGVSAVVTLFNYLIYSWLLYYGLHPLLAITISTACAMTASYLGYRHIAFRAP